MTPRTRAERWWLLAAFVLVIAQLAITACVRRSLFASGGSDFAEGLSIPAGLEVGDPHADPPERAGAPQSDPMHDAHLAAISVAATDDTMVVPDLRSLCALAATAPDRLMRHLEASEAWRVHPDRGHLVATRIAWTHGRYTWEHHGYDSSDETYGSVPESFVALVVLRLDGSTDDSSPRATIAASGTGPIVLAAVSSADAFESTLSVRCGAIVVDVFERSSGIERRITKATLRVLEAEMREVLDGAITAPGSGEPSLDVFAGFQGGIYRYEAHLNPGEPGTVHLRAFEVTRGTRLSAESIERDSSTHVGGSRDAGALFPAQGEFMIYEGDWGQYYAARIELWFLPDSGGPERKLLERVFRVEGWMR